MTDATKGGASDKNECIQVVVRCRPFNRKEKDENRGNIITMDLEMNQVTIVNAENREAEPKTFTFDSVYDENTIQRSFYEESCFGLVESVLEGFNGTIFAYGQTGCGKTFTMQGPPSPPELKGVIPNSFSHIFDHIKASSGSEYLVRCSYLEIYNEVVRDLLGDQKNPAKCDLKEDPTRGVFVSNLTDIVVENEADMDLVLNRGLGNRTVGATAMNLESSRSHSIFTIVVERNDKDPATGKDHIRAGKLNLVDLAGSERQKKTGASGDRLKEGSKINLSLSALGNVISALSDGHGKHIPYRDSKLTRLLQDSLGGNTKTLMVAAISPADYNYDETLSTLRYANRAKSIKNKPKINEDPKDAMLREYKNEIERLKAMLEEVTMNRMNGGGMNVAGSDGMSSSTKHVEEAMNNAIMNFASLAAPPTTIAQLQANDAKHSPRESPRVSPRMRSPRAVAVPPLGHSDQVRVEKEVVEVKVEIERIPESHLMKHKMLEERSAALEEERNYMDEQVKDLASEVEYERKLREEVMKRLQKIQSKVVGHASPRDGESSAQDIEQQIAAEKRQKERSSKAHKKEEARRKAEEEKLNKERMDMNEELKIAQENAAADAEKKLLKMRRKYEKKVKALRSEVDDLHEEFELEREQLLETIREQNKETRLFQEICRAVLDEKRLKQLIERCRYEEDTDEWVIPYIKQRDVDLRLPEITSSNNASSNRSEAKGTRTRPPSGNDAETRQAAAVAESKTSRRPNSRSAQDDSRVPSARGREPAYMNSGGNNRDTQSISPVMMNGNVQIQQPPTKPPKSARRDKKPKTGARQPLASPQDEMGTGEEAGSVSEWGFAPAGADSGIALSIEGAAVSMDNAMISLNHQPAMGDRQSSRQGGRRKKSSHDSKRGKGDESQHNDHLGYSPRMHNDFLPQL